MLWKKSCTSWYTWFILIYPILIIPIPWFTVFHGNPTKFPLVSPGGWFFQQHWHRGALAGDQRPCSVSWSAPGGRWEIPETMEVNWWENDHWRVLFGIFHVWLPFFFIHQLIWISCMVFRLTVLIGRKQLGLLGLLFSCNYGFVQPFAVRPWFLQPKPRYFGNTLGLAGSNCRMIAILGPASLHIENLDREFHERWYNVNPAWINPLHCMMCGGYQFSLGVIITMFETPTFDWPLNKALVIGCIFNCMYIYIYPYIRVYT